MWGSNRALNKLHLYLLAFILASVGLGLFGYKAYVLGFPLVPRTKVQVWNVEARISFVAEDKPVKLSMFIPSSTKRFALADEHFISSGYGLVASMEEGNRKAVWSIRQARREQKIYYQAVVRRVRTKAPRIEEEAPEVTSPGFECPTSRSGKIFDSSNRGQVR